MQTEALPLVNKFNLTEAPDSVWVLLSDHSGLYCFIVWNLYFTLIYQIRAVFGTLATRKSFIDWLLQLLSSWAMWLLQSCFLWYAIKAIVLCVNVTCSFLVELEVFWMRYKLFNFLVGLRFLICQFMNDAGFRKEFLGFGIMVFTKIFKLILFGLEKINLWVSFWLL